MKVCDKLNDEGEGIYRYILNLKRNKVNLEHSSQLLICFVQLSYIQ